MAVAQIVRGPALYALGNNGVVLWWETDLNGGPNKIQYWRAATDPVDAVAVTDEVFDEFGALHFVHRVVLDGLLAGTQYNYKLFAENFEDGFPRIFRTYQDDGTSIRIGVWGSNEGNTAATFPGFQNTLSVLASLNVDGYVTTGGLVADGSRYESWTDDWYAHIGTDLQSMGLSFARGESDGFSRTAMRMLPAPHPSNGYYAHSIGKARFAFLNSLEGVPRNTLRAGRPQGSWLLDTEARSSAWKNALYRVIVAHHPFRTTFWNDGCQYGESGTILVLQDGLHELVKLSGADLVLYGSSRSYQRGVYNSSNVNNTNPIVHIVTAGGGAPRHETRCFTWDAPSEPGILTDTDDYIVLRLDISGTKLAIEARRVEDSTIFDSVTIAPHTLF